MSNRGAALLDGGRAVEPGSFRHTVLLTARRFKASWVELAKLLVKVYDEALYEQWGFETFEAYCGSELRIRKATALKLLRSVRFLKKHEPGALEGEDIALKAPPFEVVEVLANAEERGQLTAQEYRSIRDSIWNPDKGQAELRKELLERFPVPERPANERASLERLSRLARHLAKELSRHRKVPKAIAERAEALADDIAELVQEQRPSEG